ncbi:hypothetical protein CXB51_034798 [Gossypium anomalum]|uniref:DUF4216 domain-containing protein n=1 Tax=Gossypium anomalum TaxID=47600 RepID=A0A8J5YBD4_9ROSI|nr:hypothetical protein CXB51_034798 [Gossypium anomalum]
MSSKTADYMRWHNDERIDDGLLRHPADSLAWRSFERKFPSFVSDPRNVRLRLAADGFSPFKIMSTSYSTWPPFIEELKRLWSGVETYDVLRNENFNLCAALLWTINDFSTYANLYCWSTNGRYACPCCAAQTCSKWLYNGKKFCYMGHHRWLDGNHRFRFQRTLFDGTKKFREAPDQTIGSEILFMLKDMDFSYGKMNQPSNIQTRRRSMDESDDEEDDPNEEHHILRHNLDVMHIEKNVCEIIIGTILNVDEKSKDNLQSRLDLIDMGIQRDLHPEVLPNGKYRLPPLIFAMLKEEKEVFCMVLKDIKVPDAYASNISRCVSLKDRRLYSLKSHDYHILMQDLLPLALRCCMSKKVMSCIIELSNIMKAICGKVLDVEELEKVQDRAALTLCNLEKIFPPSFFTIMVHLVIHLPHEAILGGPFFLSMDVPYRKVWSGKGVNDEVKWLSQGPNRVIKRYSAFLINGYRFHTKYRERMRRTQNCGIVVNSSITSYASARDSNPLEGNVEYYGLLTDIIELDYYGKWKVVLFRCDWADVNTAPGIKKDQFGFTMVNFSRLIYTGQQLMDEPYVFSSKVKQVFYSKDPTDEGWYVVIRNTPRDLFDMGKMRRRKLRDLSNVQNTPNSEEANSEQQTVIGSSNVPETLDEPTKFQTESDRTCRGRGCTLLKYLYDLNPVERVKERFTLEVSDDYIKKALGKKWRDHKSTLKKKYFKKDISLEEKLRNVPPGMLRYQWEDAGRFWNSKKGEDRERVGTSSRQKKKITYTAGSRSFAFVAEAEEKLKEKKAEYEAIASTDSSVNLENIDNIIITEQYMSSGSQAQAEVQRLRDQMAQMQASTVEQIAEVQRKYEELQQQLRAEAAAREAEVAAMATEQSRKYDQLQLQLQQMMQMFQHSQKPPS